MNKKKIGKFDGYRSNAFLGFDSPPDIKPLHSFSWSPSLYVPLRRSQTFDHKYLHRFSPTYVEVKSMEAPEPEDDDIVSEKLLVFMDSGGIIHSEVKSDDSKARHDSTDCIPELFESIEEQHCEVKDVREAEVQVDEKELTTGKKLSEFIANLEPICAQPEDNTKLIAEVSTEEMNAEISLEKKEVVQRLKEKLNLTNTDENGGNKWIGKLLTEIYQKLHRFGKIVWDAMAKAIAMPLIHFVYFLI